MLFMDGMLLTLTVPIDPSVEPILKLALSIPVPSPKIDFSLSVPLITTELQVRLAKLIPVLNAETQSILIVPIVVVAVPEFWIIILTTSTPDTAGIFNAPLVLPKR